MAHLRCVHFILTILLSVQSSIGVGPMIDPDHLILESDCGLNSAQNEVSQIYPWAIKVKRRIHTPLPNSDSSMCAGSVITKR